jgi:hypothetical protein
MRLSATSAATLILLLVSTAGAQINRATTRDSVWTWSSDCPKPIAIRFQVAVDARTIADTTIAVCRAREDRIVGPANPRRLSFVFSARHRWQGEFLTTNSDTITCDVWQAGADPRMVILGISFDTRRQVLLNSVHLLDPNRRRERAQDRGVVTTTFLPSAVKPTSSGG